MLDDATTAYILENQKCFEDLKQVASQLAGLLVLTAAGSKNVMLDQPLLASAQQLFRDACDSMRRTSPTPRASLHHHHLELAASAIGGALTAATQRLGRLEIDPILTPLRVGYSELERAAAALPGFEIVAYERACCGRHHVQ